MTSVMLACYPEVFAGGAIIAGLPYGAAANVQQAFESMFQCPPRSAPEWGGLVRGASPHNGPWPRVSIWHGSADKTVKEWDLTSGNAVETATHHKNVVYAVALSPDGRRAASAGEDRVIKVWALDTPTARARD